MACGSDNSCSVKKAEFINHVWTYDFISDQSEDGRKLELLTVLDEFTRECPAIEVGRSIRAKDVIMTLEYLFMVRGLPKFIRMVIFIILVNDCLRPSLWQANMLVLSR